MDSKIHINRNIVPGTCLVRLSGILNEDFNKKEIQQLQSTESMVVIDMDDVRRITSFGVREWVNAIKDLNIEFLGFINCRPSIIAQFNMVAKFGGSGHVVTFYAPYSCPSCEKEIEVLIDLRKQYQEVIVGKKLPKAMCPTCQVEANFDDVPDSYFSYVSAKPTPEIPPLAARLIENYKEKFSIQKDVDQDLTALWLSGPLDNSAQFKRILDGLEGNLVVILAGISATTPEGLVRFETLTTASDAKVYLSRIPMHVAASVISKKVEIGKSKICSLWASFGCQHCKKTFETEISAAFLSKKTTGGFGEHKCPHCEKMTNLQQLQHPGGWQIMQAARALISADLPKEVSEYLKEHPGILLSEKSTPVPDQPFDRTIIQAGKSTLTPSPPKSSGRHMAVSSIGGHRRCPVCKSTYPLAIGICPKDGNATTLETEQPTADPFLGKMAGNYQIAEKIGEGGMGAVYAATHINLGKKVAIKILHREYAQSKSLIERFFEEARAASQLGHEHIVDVQDFGFIDGMQLPYFAMEYLEGESLDALIEREQKLPPPVAIGIVTQLLDALTTAHKRGIVHRDLKPENIFLVKRRNNDYFVKLLDFGVAKLVHARAITHAGALIGTPHYMSPEQASGKNNEIDGRSDLYSVGVILYQLLCGTTPFMGNSFSDLVVAHISSTPKAPRAVNPAISPSLESVVVRALQKRAVDRFQSAEDMMKALAETGDFVQPNMNISGQMPSAASMTPPPTPPAPPVAAPPPLPLPKPVPPSVAIAPRPPTPLPDLPPPPPLVSAEPPQSQNNIVLLVGGIGLLIGIVIAVLLWQFA